MNIPNQIIKQIINDEINLKSFNEKNSDYRERYYSFVLGN